MTFNNFCVAMTFVIMLCTSANSFASNTVDATNCYDHLTRGATLSTLSAEELELLKAHTEFFSSRALFRIIHNEAIYQIKSHDGENMSDYYEMFHGRNQRHIDNFFDLFRLNKKKVVKKVKETILSYDDEHGNEKFKQSLEKYESGGYKINESEFNGYNRTFVPIKP